MKRDGDAVCLYVRDVKVEDSGVYECVASNREGEARCRAALDVADTMWVYLTICIIYVPD